MFSDAIWRQFLAPVPLTIFRSNTKLLKFVVHLLKTYSTDNREILHTSRQLQLKTCSTDHKNILHMSRQLHFCAVCIISLLSAQYILNQSMANFGRILVNIGSGNDLLPNIILESILSSHLSWSVTFTESNFTKTIRTLVRNTRNKTR